MLYIEIAYDNNISSIVLPQLVQQVVLLAKVLPHVALVSKALPCLQTSVPVRLLFALWVIFFYFYCLQKTIVIHSFIHSGHFYSAPSSPLLLRGAPDYSTDTVSEFHTEAHRQLQV